MTYENPVPLLPEPLPELFVEFDAAVPAVELDQQLSGWLASRLPGFVLELSHDEILLAAEEQGWQGVRDTIWLARALRTSLIAQEMRGFSAVMDQFIKITRGEFPPPPGGVLWSLHMYFGGVVTGAPGAYRLLMPGPFGEWAVSDGCRLTRYQGNALLTPAP